MKEWYVVPCEAGKENLTKLLFERIRKDEFKADLGRVLVPLGYNPHTTESGRSVIRKEKLYYGAVLVEMRRAQPLENRLRQTAGVIPSGSWSLVKSREVHQMFLSMSLQANPVVEKVELSRGDLLEILEGPFRGFKGGLLEIRGDKLLVEVELFGKKTKVEVSRETVSHSS